MPLVNLGLLEVAPAFGFTSELAKGLAGKGQDPGRLDVREGWNGQGAPQRVPPGRLILRLRGVAGAPAVLGTQPPELTHPPKRRLRKAPGSGPRALGDQGGPAVCWPYVPPL